MGVPATGRSTTRDANGEGNMNTTLEECCFPLADRMTKHMIAEIQAAARRLPEDLRDTFSRMSLPFHSGSLHRSSKNASTTKKARKDDTPAWASD